MKPMHILLVNFDPGREGGVSNLLRLFSAYCQTFVQDTLSVLCAGGSPLEDLSGYPNTRVRGFKRGRDREVRRLVWALTPGSHSRQGEPVDIILAVNVGKYLRPDVPQVILLNNAYQVYPWAEVRNHTSSVTKLAVLRWFFRRSLSHASGVIVQTPLMARYVRALAPPFLPIGMVSKAVDSGDAPGPASPRHEVFPWTTPAEGLFTFFYAASPSPHKNHLTVFSALALMSDRGVPCRLVVTLDAADVRRIGGPAAGSLMRTGRIQAAGWIEPGQLRRAYAECDGCVMPSLLESQSSAYLEAMNWGKPQIVADVPNARDLCREAALYASPEDPADWARKMEILVADSGLRSSLVEAGFGVMQTHPPTWSEAAGRIRAFLESVLMLSGKEVANQPCVHS
jgi:glycosyltransferase involved in cell wall biosynthesis